MIVTVAIVKVQVSNVFKKWDSQGQNLAKDINISK